MEFLRKIRLKHAGFVLGVVFLVSGWSIRLAAAFVLPELVSPLTAYTLDRIGYYLSGSSVVFLLGGIAFWAAISAREAKEEPREPLTEEQIQERRKSELEEAEYTVKSSIPFTAVYGFFSILLVLGSISIIMNSDQSRWLGFSNLAVGLLLCQYYIRKSVRQFRWLSWYKRTGGKEETTVIGEYTVGAPGDSPILLRIFNNGTAYAIFDNFPLNEEEAEQFIEEFSLHINAKVTRDDRELFIITSNHEDTIKKAVAFLQIKSLQWKEKDEA